MGDAVEQLDRLLTVLKKHNAVARHIELEGLKIELAPEAAPPEDEKVTEAQTAALREFLQYGAAGS